MTIPAVMFIEMAIDALKEMDPQVIEAHLKEFHALGARLENLKSDLAEQCHGQHFTNATVAYLIGIQTARVILETMPAAIQAGVTL